MDKGCVVAALPKAQVICVIKRTKHPVNILGASILLWLSFSIWAPAQAYVLHTWDLTLSGVEMGNVGGSGNYYSYNTAIGGVAPLEVSGWSNQGSDSVLVDAQANLRTDGMGSCNRNDDFVIDLGFFVWTLNCEDISSAAVENNEEQDWLLIYLPGENANEWQSIDLLPFEGADVDVTYWVGNISSPSDLNGYDYGAAGDFTSIGFGSRVDVDNVNVNDNPVSIDLTLQPNIGNAILIGGNFDQADDGFLAVSVTALVPIPPAIWLFVSAIGALAARRKIAA